MIKKNRKKGQAALEFLTTYGWAFVIVLASIGALVYFGVLDPSIFIPDRCVLGTDFVCKDYRMFINTTGGEHAQVDLIVINSMGDTLDVNMTAWFADSDFPTQCYNASEEDNVVDWLSGIQMNFSCSDSGLHGFEESEKSKVLINIQYMSSSGGFPHGQEGEIYATVFKE